MKSIAVSVLKDPKLIEELCWTAFKNGFKIGGFVGPANIKALTEDELKKLISSFSGYEANFILFEIREKIIMIKFQNKYCPLDLFLKAKYNGFNPQQLQQALDWISDANVNIGKEEICPLKLSINS